MKAASGGMAMELLDLPRDIQLRFCLHLDCASLASLAQTCSAMRELAAMEEPWLHLCSTLSVPADVAQRWRARADSARSLFRLLRSLEPLVGVWGGENLAPRGGLLYITWVSATVSQCHGVAVSECRNVATSVCHSATVYGLGRALERWEMRLSDSPWPAFALSVQAAYGVDAYRIIPAQFGEHATGGHDRSNGAHNRSTGACDLSTQVLHTVGTLEHMAGALEHTTGAVEGTTGALENATGVRSCCTPQEYWSKQQECATLSASTPVPLCLYACVPVPVCRGHRGGPGVVPRAHLWPLRPSRRLHAPAPHPRPGGPRRSGASAFLARHRPACRCPGPGPPCVSPGTAWYASGVPTLSLILPPTLSPIWSPFLSPVSRTLYHLVPHGTPLAFPALSPIWSPSLSPIGLSTLCITWYRMVRPWRFSPVPILSTLRVRWYCMVRPWCPQPCP